MTFNQGVGGSNPLGLKRQKNIWAGRAKLTEKVDNDKDNKHILIHEYNPEFELLSEEEAKKVLEGLNLNYYQLPKISVNDPVSKLFKAKQNDVFRIKRKSYTAGESIFYRVVVNG
ncbi:hypothetical protein COS83_00315 [archaeon CG07_land_8_20_14_0_80_38_8]|nr:MAG: hypothetical protein COS83_00315 [archaeon CG07_land_8_20_14_0_80_38_8]PIU89154.1 MAG: hypothetical protein COS64_01010 [archaeon CG06_land_8_20_14_3_00_37_11]